MLSYNGPFRSKWDAIIILALVYTALVTPVDTVFLQVDLNFLFWVNRVVDSIFVVDIILNFITTINKNGVVVRNHSIIASVYLRGWFILDVISVIPFGVIGFLIGEAGGEGGSALQRFKILRIIRLFRLVKLLRLVRASRILDRWESAMAMNFGVLKLLKLSAGVLLLAHWMACGFKLVVEFEAQENNWLSNYFNALGYNPEDFEGIETWARQYLAALYWAVMTTTTIGYGDITPVTDGERVFGIFTMMIGGTVYAYVVGGICGIFASMDEETAAYHHKLDFMNSHMDEREYPHELRLQVRAHLNSMRKIARIERVNGIFHELSPDLRGHATRWVNRRPLTAIPYTSFAKESNERAQFITSLALQLKVACFPRGERLAKPGDFSDKLYIVCKGKLLLNRSGFLKHEHLPQGHAQFKLDHVFRDIKEETLVADSFFGEEMVLAEYRKRYHVIALENVELICLAKNRLEKIFLENNFPSSQRELNKYIGKLALRLKLVATSKKVKKERARLRREQAQRKSLVQSQLVRTMSQRERESIGTGTWDPRSSAALLESIESLAATVAVLARKVETLETKGKQGEL